MKTFFLSCFFFPRCFFRLNQQRSQAPRKVCRSFVVHRNWPLGHFGSHWQMRPWDQKELIHWNSDSTPREISLKLSKRKVKKSLLRNQCHVTAENTDLREPCLFKNETLPLWVWVDRPIFQGPAKEMKKGTLCREATVSLRRTKSEQWLSGRQATCLRGRNWVNKGVKQTVVL